MTNHRTRRTLATASLLVLAGATLAACGDDDEGTDASGGEAGSYTATVQLSWIKNAEFAGEFMADSRGYFEDEGFESVTLTPGPTATENLVASGQAQFGLSNAVATAQAIVNGGAPLKVVGATYQKNPFTILSLADAGNIATPDDLRGKKIGVQDSNLALFDAFLAANGLTEDDLTVVPVQYDPSVLVDGQVDGFMAYLTNESIIVESEGNAVTNLPFADNGLPFVAETVIASDELIEENPDMVKAFLAAEILGWKDACDEVEEGARLAVEEYGADLDLDLEKEVAQNTIQCEELIHTDETAENGIFTISDELIAQNMESLDRAGITISEDELFDLSLLTELLEERPELKVTE